MHPLDINFRQKRFFLIITLWYFLGYILLLIPLTGHHESTSLFKISTSTYLQTRPFRRPKPINGPSIFIHPFGTCSRTLEGTISCNSDTLHPKFDFSVLPQKPRYRMITLPPLSPQVVYIVGMTIVGVSRLYSCFLFVSNARRPMRRWSLRIGLIGSILVLPSMLLYRMWFGLAADHFNFEINDMGPLGVPLLAELGDGLTYMYVGLGILGGCFLIELDVTSEFPLRKLTKFEKMVSAWEANGDDIPWEELEHYIEEWELERDRLKRKPYNEGLTGISKGIGRLKRKLSNHELDLYLWRQRAMTPRRNRGLRRNPTPSFESDVGDGPETEGSEENPSDLAITSQPPSTLVNNERRLQPTYPPTNDRYGDIWGTSIVESEVNGSQEGNPSSQQLPPPTLGNMGLEPIQGPSREPNLSQIPKENLFFFAGGSQFREDISATDDHSVPLPPPTPVHE